MARSSELLWQVRVICIAITALASLDKEHMMNNQSWGRDSAERPLGITIIGGLIFSQVLTLYTTPVIYLAFDRLANRFRKSSAPERVVDSLGEDWT